jgi:hypothetical protein
VPAKEEVARSELRSLDHFFLFLIKYYLSDQIKDKQIGGACGTGGKTERRTGFWRGSQNEEDHTEDLILDGRIIVKYTLLEKGGMTWNGLIWL